MKQFDGDALAHWLDGDLSDDIPDENMSREDFANNSAETMFVHALLTDVTHRDLEREEHAIRQVMDNVSQPMNEVGSKRERVHGSLPNRRFYLATSAVVIAASLFLMIFFDTKEQRAIGAVASLQKVLEASHSLTDRTYHIHVLEEYGHDRKPLNLSQEAWEFEPKENIDGATLFVRGLNQFVLVIPLKSGKETRTLGCDGAVSWSFRDSGPVRISSDLRRFRGKLPGQQQDLPFVNLYDHVSQLERGYSISLEDAGNVSGNNHSLARLVGVRQSRDIQGPKRIEIVFDAVVGTIHSMILDGLPRGRGGPKCVKFDLKDESSLGEAFFSHTAHHGLEKEIQIEDHMR
jgi:hypothetical protein